MQPDRNMTPIADIRIPDTRRRGHHDVAALAESMARIGLIHPVTVTPDGVLVAGLHRLEAARALGWEEIAIDVMDADARLVEIDENLVRVELTELERIGHLAERKQVYEALHPDTGIGKAPGAGRGKGGAKRKTENISFSQDAAKKTGVTTRSIEMAVKLSNDLDDDVKETIRNLPAADNQAELIPLWQEWAERRRQARVASM